ncbi:MULTISPECIES: hypothetical protein [Halolamina]|uniref:Small CPxCG-related zinc finger protein n=1 Tax=Halolamina pelagica TaxID=699431 RepID=A0A1I5V7A3_9EURY|nr:MULTISPECIES: hypothetical protein [Halolamina]NHX37911.1 hypothetical protein [Halolamina sp. R1-12]SFQ03237.1 hypothetical protein SAMN05216277_11642 [Halolamina pelagica]
MATRRCPDCGVTMEETTTRTSDGFELHLVTDEPKEGLLGSLGAKEKLKPTTYVCPECGLVRQYVDT